MKNEAVEYAFERCVDVMARLIEKYGVEEETTYIEKTEEDIA